MMEIHFLLFQKSLLHYHPGIPSSVNQMPAIKPTWENQEFGTSREVEFVTDFNEIITAPATILTYHDAVAQTRKGSS